MWQTKHCENKILCEIRALHTILDNIESKLVESRLYDSYWDDSKTNDIIDQERYDHEHLGNDALADRTS